jgi:crossover junction endodeoxyribonuclease RusA
MDPISFWVAGKPRPKGSMAIIPRRHVRPVMVRGEPHYRIRDLYVGAQRSVRNGQHVDLLAPWVTAVKAEALYHKPRGQGLPGPFAAEMVFHVKRPAKTIHPEAPIGPPDVDKLVRAVDDALTGMIWEDDAQVVRLVGEKRWSGERGPGVLVTVNHLEDQTDLF